MQYTTESSIFIASFFCGVYENHTVSGIHKFIDNNPINLMCY